MSSYVLHFVNPEQKLISNFIQSIFQAVQPQSSVAFFHDVFNRHLSGVIPILSFVAIITSLSIYGIIISKHKKICFLVTIVLPLSMFPVILLNHISELYVYTMMPLVSMLLSIGLGTILEKSSSITLKVLISVIIITFLAWNTSSNYSKSVLMFKNGSEAENILQKIQPFYTQIPFKGKLILVNPVTSNKTEYSIYKRTGFRLLEDGIIELSRRSGRTDFSTLILTYKELKNNNHKDCLFLEYENGNVYRIYQ